MAFERPSQSEGVLGGIPSLINRLTDGLGTLVTDHITLARLELSEDAREVGGELARIAVFVPFVLVGYAFVCGAIALALAPLLGYAGAAGLVGAVNVAGGGFGLYRAAMRLRSRRVLDDSLAELNQTRAVFSPPAAGTDSAARNTVKELNDGQ